MNELEGARLRPLEGLVFILTGYFLCAFILWVFYDTKWGLFFAILSVYPSVILGKRYKHKKSKQKLKSRFTDALSCIDSSLEAGESPEGAVHSGLKELTAMYSPQDIMVRKFEGIIRQLYTNRNLEEAFLNFAEEIKDEDISNYAEVFALAKRSGGNISEVIKSTEKTLTEKQEVLREIDTLITAKRLEASIMALMPPGIILYFRLFDATFIDALYSGLTGRMIMTAMLGAYILLIYLMLRITDISV